MSYKRVFRLYYWFNDKVQVEDFTNEVLAQEFINDFDIEVFNSMWTMTNQEGTL